MDLYIARTRRDLLHLCVSESGFPFNISKVHTYAFTTTPQKDRNTHILCNM